jgi:predicted SAM-dependent methyltransferase
VDARPAADADRFAAWATMLGQPTPPLHSGPKGLVARLVAPRLRPRLRLAATGALRPWARRLGARLQARSRDPLRLHLGCGATYKDGWVNVDLAGTRVDLPWDLARPLPFAPGSIHTIFHEHLLEHLTYAQGIELHRRCRELLRPGGVLRIGVPDAGAALRSYAAADPASSWESDCWPTPMARIASLTYDSGHRAMYDAETLELSCLAAGFPCAERREPGAGDVRPNPDSPTRRDSSLYVEAIA